MDRTTLSTGVGGYSGTDIAKSNLVPIRAAGEEPSAAATGARLPEDRFTPSAFTTDSADKIADTVTLTSAAAVPPVDSAREARVADVIAAVRNGTYRIDPKAVANALVARMTGSAADLTQNSSSKEDY